MRGLNIIANQKIFYNEQTMLKYCLLDGNKRIGMYVIFNAKTSLSGDKPVKRRINLMDMSWHIFIFVFALKYRDKV